MSRTNGVHRSAPLGLGPDIEPLLARGRERGFVYESDVESLFTAERPWDSRAGATVLQELFQAGIEVVETPITLAEAISADVVVVPALLVEAPERAQVPGQAPAAAPGVAVEGSPAGLAAGQAMRRWLAGDLHTHSVHSDGVLTPVALACLAAEGDPPIPDRIAAMRRVADDVPDLA